MGLSIELDRRPGLGVTIDPTNEAEVRRWAARFCVTPNELREILEEIGDRPARFAKTFGGFAAGR